MDKDPGYIDLQVNGYGGVDFNQDDLSADDLHLACQSLARDGVKAILATIITEDFGRMCRRLARLVELRRADPLAATIIAGFHIEGPFISPADGYRGAHPRDAVLPAQIDSASRLLDAADGLTRIVTLAPECDPGLRVTRMLSRRNVVVSAGHSDASLDQLRAAIDAGLSMFTHVGNACPMTMHRHDNIIQRVLSLADRLWLSFIADGVHVPFFALRNYLRLAGIERCVIVTDAIAPAGKGPGRYRLGRWDLVIGDDLAARAPDGSHLVGSAMTMKHAESNLKTHLGLSAEQVRQLTSINPGKVMRAAGR
jgi:N-acetylglucosamine-6-phosphate deacetylase